ncbi:Hypothetical predicted protein [Octopus vulgaris]|uniref:Uncharacterized protein n=1 Tax=Octopus vulgaris TaxID=6645 RepID=A0AA36B2X4_OCTVU|nr:Hypothetical predicted protein [Octopus vulgaris]
MPDNELRENTVKEKVVVESFKKYDVSNTLDGTEDDLLFEDIDDPDPIAENSSDEERTSNMDGNSENE